MVMESEERQEPAGDNCWVFSFLVDLLGLLKWRSNTSLLHQNLKQLMKVDGGEVVKVMSYCL